MADQAQYRPEPFLKTEDLTSIVITLHGIDEEHRSAILARIKFWNRRGFPRAIHVGTGKTARYGSDKLFQVLLAFELAELGHTPAHVFALINENWSQLRVDIATAWKVKLGLEEHCQNYWTIPSTAFSSRFRDPAHLGGKITKLDLSPEANIVHSQWLTNTISVPSWSERIFGILRDNYFPRLPLRDFMGTLFEPYEGSTIEA